MLSIIGLPFIILGITQGNAPFVAIGIALSISFFAIEQQNKKNKRS